MRLLIITQKVDNMDPVLGFMHAWIRELSMHGTVEVICLERGTYDLPGVHVHSLGKEYVLHTIHLIHRVIYAGTFLYYIFNLRKKYDTVFVHMNQEYVLLGGLFLKLLRKKILLWRNHLKGNVFTRIAVYLSDTVFYTSAQSFTARFKNAVQMPVGIDTKTFYDMGTVKNPKSILVFGRISPVKNLQMLPDILNNIKEAHPDMHISLYGSVAERDYEYSEALKELMTDLMKEGIVSFHDAVALSQAPSIFNAHTFYINLTPSGSFDKTIIEAMACGTIPLVINEAGRGMLADVSLCIGCDTSALSQKLNMLLLMEKTDQEKYVEANRALVERKHSLQCLVDTLLLYI